MNTSIATSNASLEAIYNDPLMKKTPYYLHSVLVHQGEASGGHYWAYTRKHPSLNLVATPISSLSKPGSSSTPDLRSLGQSSAPHQSTSSQTTQEEPASVSRRRNSLGNVVAPASLAVNDSKASLDVRNPTYHRQLETGEVCIDVGQCADSSQPIQSVQSTEEVVTTESRESMAGSGMSEKSENMEIEKVCSGSSLSVGLPSPVSLGTLTANSDTSCVPGSKSSWIKFNDVSVSEVKWEDVRRESMGGVNGNTSAYCLVYLNRELHQNWVDGGEKHLPRPTLVCLTICCIYVSKSLK